VPPLLVHASLEHRYAAWGGISSALDLLVAASASAGQPVAVISLGASDQVIPLGASARLYVVGMPELADTTIYRHPDRVRLARLASERMAQCLASIRHGAEVDLCVHNDELVHLVELCSARPWLRSCTGFIHGLARQEHPGRPELHQQQDGFVNAVGTVAVLSGKYAQTVRWFYPALRSIAVVTPPLTLLTEEAAGRRQRRSVAAIPGTFLAAGRSVPQKGFDILLRALRNIPPGPVQAVHLIMGHGDAAYEARCTSLAERTAVKVHLSPWTTRTAVLEAIVTAWAVIMPSRFEPLGLLGAEALAHNVPVIASSVDGLQELVADPTVGWLVPASEGAGPNERQLADTILAAASCQSAVSSGAEYLRRWRVADCLTDLARLLERGST
jgi:glycosyltransferase involved in cell wall biosynthesis